MKRSRQLEDLALVAKYYPVANYSYPRADAAPRTLTRCSTINSDRSSLGSDASAPGLVDDRASEVSIEDDYQYHAHTAELWDSFWQPQAMRDEESAMMAKQRLGQPETLLLLHPSKQYPALIPSPRHRKRPPPPADSSLSAWPLPDGSPRERTRKPAASFAASPPAKPRVTYSAFPKPTPLPVRTSSKLARKPLAPPSPTRPLRPPRPTDELLTPCLQQMARMMHALYAPAHDTTSPTFPPPSSPTMDRRPSSAAWQRPSRSFDERLSPRAVATPEPSAKCHRSSTHLPLTPSDAHPPRHIKSIAQLVAQPPPRPQPEAPVQPISVFEYDDTSSEGETDPRRSLFRFHKRTHSDVRCSTKTPNPVESASTLPQPGRRKRALTAPSSPAHPQPNRLSKPETPGRKRTGHNVLGRMLGRRMR